METSSQSDSQKICILCNNKETKTSTTLTTTLTKFVMKDLIHLFVLVSRKKSVLHDCLVAHYKKNCTVEGLQIAKKRIPGYHFSKEVKVVSRSVVSLSKNCCFLSKEVAGKSHPPPPLAY